MQRPRVHFVNIRCLIFGVVIVCLFGLPAYGQPWLGSGTEGDPYQIWDACDMQAIGADANFWDAHFRLMADIDLAGYTGTSFNIIGTWDEPLLVFLTEMVIRFQTLLIR